MPHSGAKFLCQIPNLAWGVVGQHFDRCITAQINLAAVKVAAETYMLCCTTVQANVLCTE